MTPNHYSLAPCHEQPGRQQWHLACSLRHPVKFVRTRGTLLNDPLDPVRLWDGIKSAVRR